MPALSKIIELYHIGSEKTESLEEFDTRFYCGLFFDSIDKDYKVTNAFIFGVGNL
jgi:hypothetical protein